MRYIPLGQDDEQMLPPRQNYAPQQMPQMQAPQLDWSTHPANQPMPQQQGGGEGVDWSKMFGGQKAIGPTSDAEIAANSAVGGNFGMAPPPAASAAPPPGGASVGSMASAGAEGAGGAMASIGSAISGF